MLKKMTKSKLFLTIDSFSKLKNFSKNFSNIKFTSSFVLNSRFLIFFKLRSLSVYKTNELRSKLISLGYKLIFLKRSELININLYLDLILLNKTFVIFIQNYVELIMFLDNFDYKSYFLEPFLIKYFNNYYTLTFFKQLYGFMEDLTYKFYLFFFFLNFLKS